MIARPDRRHGHAARAAGVGRRAMGHSRGLKTTLAAEFQLDAPIDEWLKDEPRADRRDAARARRRARATRQYDAQGSAGRRRSSCASSSAASCCRSLDTHWREHLAALDHLRQGIHLRGYAQKNPKQEYKREAFELFSDDARPDQARRRRRSCSPCRCAARRTCRRSRKRRSVTNVQYQHADYDEALAPQAGDGCATSRVRDAPPFVRAGRRSAATIPVPAARARSTSSATAGSSGLQRARALTLRRRS